jgi:hypothetical protein
MCDCGHVWVLFDLEANQVTLRGDQAYFPVTFQDYNLGLFLSIPIVYMEIDNEEASDKEVSKTMKIAPTTYPPVPHCDDLVLHSPGQCTYCDEYPDAQNQRLLLNIPFSGEGGSPDEERRPREAIDSWPGNRAEAPN